jgi:crotonobetainyl-CoA:carnitine CoA-transferase CaiB-like acyl-CoA transferase
MHPLKGIKVIEFAPWLAGPAAGAVLADWGANVIKIEDLKGGDPLRGLQTAIGIRVENWNPMFEVDNRNKRSIAMDVKKDRGRGLAYKLIRDADVFLSSYREAALERLKLDYETLSQLNPRLIYASASGYGRKGEERNKEGYDAIAYWARVGSMLELGEDDAPPVPLIPGMGDQPTGLALAGGIALALFVRERTGIAQRVDISLIASGIWMQSLNIATTQSGDYYRASRKRAPNPLLLHYKAKDGKYIMPFLLQPDRYWSDFCKAMELEHLENAPRFSDWRARATNSAETVSILEEVFATKTLDEWVERFKEHNLIFDVPKTFSDVYDDPQVLANDYLVTLDHPQAGPIKLPASPLEFSKTPASVRTLAPQLGEHTEEILLETGCSWEQISELKDAKVII